MKFFELQVGAKFIHFGKVYRKIGPGLAEEVATRDALTFPHEGKQADVEPLTDQPATAELGTRKPRPLRRNKRP